MKSFLSAKQCAAKLNNSVSVKLIYKLVSQGRLRGNRATGKLLIEEDSLVELMEGKQRGPPIPEEPPPPVRPRGRPKKKVMELW